MTALEFTVAGPIVPKARARTFMQHGRVITTSAPKSRAYEQLVRDAGMIAARRARWHFGEASQFTLKLAVYWQDRRRHDLDNVAKSIGDALNGIAWDDDSQVTELHVLGHVDVDAPRVLVRVERRQ